MKDHIFQILFTIFLVSSCRQIPSSTQISTSVKISPAQAYTKYTQGAFFLDVRSPKEWDQFHIKESTLIPLGQLPDRLSEVPKDRELVVVCLSGHRSKDGADFLRQVGYQIVFSLGGGLITWMITGHRLEKAVP